MGADHNKLYKMETYAEKRFGRSERSDSFGEDEDERDDRIATKKNSAHRSVVIGKGKNKSSSPGKVKEVSMNIMEKMGDQIENIMTVHDRFKHL